MNDNFEDMTKKYKDEILKIYSDYKKNTPLISKAKIELETKDETAPDKKNSKENITELLEETDMPNPEEDFLKTGKETEKELPQQEAAEVPPKAPIIAVPAPIAPPSTDNQEIIYQSDTNDTWLEPKDYPGTGKLKVLVRFGNRAFPISNANVVIETTDKNNVKLVKLLKTDASGSTEDITLPTPSPDLSLIPGEKTRPYSKYDIYVTYEGFYKVGFKDVPIFPGITSMQTVDMIPLPADVKKSFKVVTVQEEEPKL